MGGPRRKVFLYPTASSAYGRSKFSNREVVVKLYIPDIGRHLEKAAVALPIPTRPRGPHHVSTMQPSSPSVDLNLKSKDQATRTRSEAKGVQ